MDDLHSGMAALAKAEHKPVFDDDKQRREFEAKAKDLMDWLCANGHPHMTIIITPTSAQLLEGSMAFTTSEFVRD